MRRRILECTLDLLAEVGFRRFTMDLVAAGLRISKRTLYEHFTGKEQLLTACLEEWMHRRRLFERTDGILIDELCVLHAGIRSMDLPRVVRACRELRQSCYPVYRFFLDRLSDYAEACGIRVVRDVEAGYLCRTVTPQAVRVAVSDFLIRLFDGDPDAPLHRESCRAPEILLILMRGLCTIKGRAYLDQRLKTIS